MEEHEAGARRGRTLVLGVGNPIMADDGAGPAAVAAFERTYEVPPGVDVLDGGTGGLGLLDAVEGYGRVVIADCVSAGREPGTVVTLEGGDVPRVLSGRLSAHQAGVADLVALLDLRGRLPERLAVVGVEPERIEVGLELSHAVARSLPRLVEAVAEQLRAWGIPVRPRPGGAARG